MSLVVDILFLILLLFSFNRGWKKGFMSTFMGPLSLILGSIIAVIYYWKTSNFLWAIAIGTFGPMVIWVILELSLKSWKKFTKDEEVSFFSSLLGGFLSAAFSICLFTLSLTFVRAMPKETSMLMTARNIINNSYSSKFVNHHLEKYIPIDISVIEQVATVVNDPVKVQEIQETEEFEVIMSNKNVSEFLEDEEAVNILQQKKYFELLGHPKMKSILKDKALVKDILDLHKTILEKGEEEVSGEESPKHKIVEIE